MNAPLDPSKFRPANVLEGPSPPRVIALEVSELLEHDFPAMEPLLTPWLCKQHLSMVYCCRRPKIDPLIEVMPIQN